MQVQSPRAEFPNTSMSIRALKVCTSSLSRRIDIPASASLIGNQRPAVGFCDLLCEDCIVLDGFEAVLDREGRALEFAESLREVMICLLREYELRSCRSGHLESLSDGRRVGASRNLRGSNNGGRA